MRLSSTRLIVSLLGAILVAAACSPAPSPLGRDAPSERRRIRRPIDRRNDRRRRGRRRRVRPSRRSIVTNAGDGSGRLFVVEQEGRIRIVKDGALVERPFIDITGRITSGGERGLLGLAFHPDYPTDPRFFVDYTDRDGNTVVSSFTVERRRPGRRGSRQRDDPDAHRRSRIANHNGGAVEFGPDGMLYIAMGDGGSGGDPQGNGQRLDTLPRQDPADRRRRRARIGDRRTRSRADNPFVNEAEAKPGDLAVRPAQSVADALRPRDRRPVDR